jgi:hypothetical protein
MLISSSYRKEQQRLHGNSRYGAASKKFADIVHALIDAEAPETMLDYGAGKCALRTALGDMPVAIHEYDPCVRRISKHPKGVFDMVCCIDVLEHIEPELLGDVLKDIRAMTGKLAFFTVHTGPAGKFLSDGRNAHLIQQPMKWWKARLKSHFRQVEADMNNETTLIAVCRC